MGWFSKKTKTYVNTAISRLIDDKDIPDINKTALVDYMFGDPDNRNGFVKTERSYADYLALANANSIASKLGNARRWAIRKYTYGVPEGNVLDPTLVDVRNILDEYLTKTLGKQVRLNYGLFMPANNLHMAWQKLIDLYGYNPDTNRLSALNGAYLEDIQIHYCANTIDNLIDPDTVAQYGLPATYGKTDSRTKDVRRIHSPYVRDPAMASDTAKVTYSEMVNGVKVVKELFITFLEYEWSGSPPEDGLDDSDTGNIEPEAIAPIISDQYLERDYLMAQYISQNTDGTESIGYFTYEYGSNQIMELENLFNTRQLLGRYYPSVYFRLWGTNLASDPYKDTDEYKSSTALCNKLGLHYKSVSDQIHEAVGSVGDVSQMLLSCQLPVNTDDPIIIEYMYNYFYALYNQLPDKFAGTEYSSLKPDYINGYSKEGMSVNIGDRVYSSNVHMNSIGYVDMDMIIGDVGETKRSYELLIVDNGKGGFRGRSSMPKHTFTRQLTATTCRVLTIYGLSATQYVQGGHTTTASRGDENLVLPMDDAIARFLPMKDRSALYSKSLVIIINTIKVVKEKWYQTGLFKAVMFVIAVVISIFTNGAGMGLYAVLYAVAQTLVIGLVVSIVVKFLVDKFNLKVGAIFAIIAVVLIAVGGAAYLSDAGSIMGMTSAQFMQAANYSIQVSSMGNKMEMINMGKAHAAYGIDMEAKMDEIRELQDELRTDAYLSPYYLLSDSIRIPDIRPGEILNDFLHRTLKVDMGLSTLDTIPNMVALTVKLPTFQDTYLAMQKSRGV